MSPKVKVEGNPTTDTVLLQVKTMGICQLATAPQWAGENEHWGEGWVWVTVASSRFFFTQYLQSRREEAQCRSVHGRLHWCQS